MSTIVVILTFMSRTNFVLNSVEHVKSVLNSRPNITLSPNNSLHMDQYTKLWSSSQQPASTAQANLRIWEDSQIISCMYTQYECRSRLRPKFRSVVYLDMPVSWAFIRSICSLAKSTKISCAGHIYLSHRVVGSAVHSKVSIL